MAGVGASAQTLRRLRRQGWSLRRGVESSTFEGEGVAASSREGRANAARRMPDPGATAAGRLASLGASADRLDVAQDRSDRHTACAGRLIVFRGRKDRGPCDVDVRPRDLGIDELL